MRLGPLYRVTALLNDMGMLEVLVDHRVVVNHAKNKALLGDKFLVTATLNFLDRRRLDLKAGLRKVGM